MISLLEEVNRVKGHVINADHVYDILRHSVFCVVWLVPMYLPISLDASISIRNGSHASGTTILKILTTGR